MLKHVTTGSTPQQVWERLLRNEPLFILDVRNRDEFERWRVEGPHPVPSFNIPYFELLDLEGEQDDVTEDEVREAMLQLDPLWDELFPAEQARIVQLLVERVDVGMGGVEVRLRPNGLAGLVREVAGARRAAA